MIDVKNMRWSFSRLNSFYTCKLAWKKTYIDKEKGDNNCFAQYGLLVHEILEKYAKEDLAVFELPNEFEKDFVEKITYDFPPNKYVDLFESYHNEGIDYFNNFDGFDEFKILGVEKEIKFKLDDYEFIGYIDLLLEDKSGNIIVFDHKSKSGFKSKKEKAEYARQLYLYSIPVIDEIKKYPTKLIFNTFRKQKLIEVPFVLKDFEEAKKWAIDTIELIAKEENFEENPDMFNCNYLCNHRYNCDCKA